MNNGSSGGMASAALISGRGPVCLRLSMSVSMVVMGGELSTGWPIRLGRCSCSGGRVIGESGRGGSSHVTFALGGICLGFSQPTGFAPSAFVVRRLPNQVTSCVVEEAFRLLGVVAKWQGCKPCPSLCVSPLGLGDELLYPGFDPSLDSRDYVRTRGGCQLVHELAAYACA
jgi:hypothetical protein